MIEFDDILHQVTIDGITVTLKPLSFKMLQRLALSRNESVSIKDLETAVWGDVVISPETLKQRIFVLRKALSDAGISNISIQAVRGEGYRMILEQAEQPVQADRRKRWLGMMAFFGLVTVIAFAYFASKEPAYAPVNNRMVLWSNTQTDVLPTEVATLYEDWRSLLSGANQSGTLQLIFSRRQEAMSLRVQARKNRAALISYFELVSLEGQPAIRLQIIEPSTATTLRSDLMLPSALSENRALMESQLKGLLALLASGKLYLDKEQRDNAKAPIWAELRQLANPD